MASFFESFFKPNSYLGVDIGTTSIKLVEISRKNKIIGLENYGYLESYGHFERVNDAIQTSGLKLFDKDVIELLRLLLKEVNVKSKYVVASVPAFSVFITTIDMPAMSESEVGQAMQYQARQYIPMPISDVMIDWIKTAEIIDENNVKKQRFLLVAVPNELILTYQNIFKAVGLKLSAIEVESLSTARALVNGDPATTLVIDIGSRSTNISIVDQGILTTNHQTDFAGASLTQALANGLTVNNARAEEIKKQLGLMGSGGEYELSSIISMFLDVIIKEAIRTKDGYEKDYGRKVERVILSGGGANLLGIEKYIEKQLGLPTVKANPFSRLEHSKKIDPIVNEISPLLSVAIGLGIKEIL